MKAYPKTTHSHPERNSNHPVNPVDNCDCQTGIVLIYVLYKRENQQNYNFTI